MAKKKPKMHVENKIINFDTIYYENPIRKANVLLHNKGKGMLYIEGIYADCNCTIIENKINNVNPGCNDTLRIKFRANNLFPGEHSKNIYIKSNSPNELDTIIIRAYIKDISM